MDYFEAQNTHVILIGASTFDAPEFHNLPAALNNVVKLKELLESKEVGIPSSQITYKIDPIDRGYLLKRIKKIFNKKGIRNFILYYAGHGVLDERDQLHLSLSSSTQEDIAIDGLSFSSLSGCFNDQSVKAILILDCCYSEKSFQYLAQRNELVLVSSSRVEPSIYPEGSTYSEFTGTFIKVLENGIDSEKQVLTFGDVFQGVLEEMEAKGLSLPRKSDRNDVESLNFTLNNFHKKEKQELKRKAKIELEGSPLERYLQGVSKKFAKWKEKFVEIEGKENDWGINTYVKETDWYLIDEAEEDNDPEFEEEDSDDEGSDFAYHQRRQGNISALRNEINQMVIVGDPGIGKTTTLIFLAYLDSVSKDKIPVLIELKHFLSGDNFYNIIQNRLKTDDAETDHLLQNDNVRLYLDGLNEIINENLGRLARIEISRFLEEYPTMDIIISSRPLSYSNEFEIPVFHLQLMNEERIKEFIFRNYDHSVKGATFFKTLKETPQLYRLSRNPLMLSILLEVLKVNKGKLPNNKGQIIRDFFKIKGIVDSLLIREKNEKEPLSTGIYHQKVVVLPGL